MNQIIVTLEKNADENFLRRMIENMKGVLKTSLYPSNQTNKGNPQFMDSLHSIKKSIDPNAIDLSDPRTNYIMSVSAFG